MSDTRSVLIYDGECPMCSLAAVAVRRLDDVLIIGWDEPASQSFLREQFEEVPFTLVLVDPNERALYLGRDAAQELADRAGMPRLVGGLVEAKYDSLADTVQRTVGSGRSPDRVGGLTPFEIDQSYRTLVAAASDPAQTAEPLE